MAMFSSVNLYTLSRSGGQSQFCDQILHLKPRCTLGVLYRVVHLSDAFESPYKHLARRPAHTFEVARAPLTGRFFYCVSRGSGIHQILADKQLPVVTRNRSEYWKRITVFKQMIH